MKHHIWGCFDKIFAKRKFTNISSGFSSAWYLGLLAGSQLYCFRSSAVCCGNSERFTWQQLNSDLTGDQKRLQRGTGERYREIWGRIGFSGETPTAASAKQRRRQKTLQYERRSLNSTSCKWRGEEKLFFSCKAHIVSFWGDFALERWFTENQFLHWQNGRNER